VVAATGFSRGAGWRGVLAAHAANLVGIGLSRFAYAPLIPAVIGAHWFLPSAAAYLGAANLAGYLAGALLARRLAAWIATRVLLRAMMILAAVSFFACAEPLPFLWFFFWRFASGLAGGVLMALAAPTILPEVAPSRRGLASGVIFAGVGLGIVASGTLVPLLLRSGLAAAWCGLGALALALSALAWSAWPADANYKSAAPAIRMVRQGPLLALYLEYALIAMALVPHMVFLVDFLARGLGHGIDDAAQIWVLYGIGAILGPMLAGAIADRIGFRYALRSAFAVQACAIAVVASMSDVPLLMASAFLVGGLTTGGVALVLGRVRELTGGQSEPQVAAWSIATVSFAVGQAASAYFYSFLFAEIGSYGLLFAFGAALAALAFAIDIASSRALPGKEEDVRGREPWHGGARELDNKVPSGEHAP